MRRAHCLTLGLATLALAATGFSAVAQAQSAPPQYLRWAGRPDISAMPSPDAATQRAAGPRRPNRVIPHGGAVSTNEAPPPASARPALTPANAWLRAPQPAPAPAAAPAPVRTASPAPVRTLPDYIPEQGGRGQPVPAEVALATPQPPAAAPADQIVDPMAPRRDAPIFRLQQNPPPQSAPQSAPQGRTEAPPATATEPQRVAMVAANPDDRPGDQGARYYSVHRQSGRQPDPVTLPAPTYVDALAITTPVSIASQDLAQPEPGPTLIRDAQGRTRIQPVAPEGDYQ